MQRQKLTQMCSGMNSCRTKTLIPAGRSRNKSIIGYSGSPSCLIPIRKSSLSLSKGIIRILTFIIIIQVSIGLLPRVNSWSLILSYSFKKKTCFFIHFHLPCSPFYSHTFIFLCLLKVRGNLNIRIEDCPLSRSFSLENHNAVSHVPLSYLLKFGS